MRWTIPFSQVSLKDISKVGGKNASLGELLQNLSACGVRVPDGFAITSDGYRHFLRNADLEGPIRQALSGMKEQDIADLNARSKLIRNRILRAELPKDLVDEIVAAYGQMATTGKVDEPYVAVRSSATAEDLPDASFAGQQETYLSIHGVAELLDAVKRCFASLFTSRAINYRAQRGYDHMTIALSVGIQHMVRADRASAGVMFTLDTESGFRDAVLISSAWGYGEGIVQGKVTPDEFYVHKPTLKQGYRALVWRKLGSKESRVIYDDGNQRLRTVPTSLEERNQLSISDDEVLTLAKWGIAIEEHYSQVRGKPTPMDIEWAKDAVSGQLFIVQARPETVHSQKQLPTLTTYKLLEKGRLLSEGKAVGEAIASGEAQLITSPDQAALFRPKHILVTQATDPDWDPIMKIASAIITERGGRTSHAAIVAREIGIPAIVGASGATTAIKDRERITASCADGEIGHVYAGELKFDKLVVDPSTLPSTRTKIMLNVAQPDQAFRSALLPSDGVGLARMEFVFSGWVGIHPLAILRFDSLPNKVKNQVEKRSLGIRDKREFFIDRLSQGIATLAAAFYPRPVILRFSDFKSNEYASLVGGQAFEPNEENPMIGWRGASRYYHPEFREGFMLEVAAVRRVRETMGLTNLKVMVPFCRTPEEGAKVLEVAAEGGLHRGKDQLEVYVMAEIPSNVLLADKFAEIFDGFSIGSNDLTQLILGVDRDSDRVAQLFDERNDAVKRACSMLIETAHRAGKPVGICGQAPSDYPEFAGFLVEQGIDSISLSPDALIATKIKVAEAERKLNR